MKPLILLNFKTYPETLGEKGLRLAEKMAKIRSRKYTITLAPTLPMIKEVVGKANSYGLPLLVFSQHADPVEDGAHTGSISVKELGLLGVKGTLLNHSERKISLPVLAQTIELCRKYNLITVVCASSLPEVKKVAQFHPDYLAYEPPELIGGNVSVTNAKPEVIREAVELVRKLSPATKVLCGAGIQGREDLQKALQLGAQGVLIGHAAAKAKNPQEFLERLFT